MPMYFPPVDPNPTLDGEGRLVVSTAGGLRRSASSSPVNVLSAEIFSEQVDVPNSNPMNPATVAALSGINSDPDGIMTAANQVRAGFRWVGLFWYFRFIADLAVQIEVLGRGDHGGPFYPPLAFTKGAASADEGLGLRMAWTVENPGRAALLLNDPKVARNLLAGGPGETVSVNVLCAVLAVP